jgi:outer membrane lipoprotein SlyB
MAVPTRAVILVGIGLWLVALVVTLVVPALHTGDRSWWPWTCVTGAALGGFAYWFVGRGRGNAAGA